MDDSPNTPLKRCVGQCKHFLPATPDFFSRNKSSKDKLQPMCKACTKEYKKLHYQTHKDEISRQHKVYRDTHKEEIKEHRKRYRRDNIDKIKQRDIDRREYLREYNRRYSQEHREYFREWNRNHRRPAPYTEKRRAWCKQYQATHKEHYRDWRRQYNQTERGKAANLASIHNRRSRKLAITGSYTPQQVREQYDRQKGKCYYCHHKVQWGKHELEHTFPLSRVVGTDIPANDISYLVITCKPCNRSKGNKFPWEWFEGGRLL